MRRLYWMSTESLNDPEVFQNYYREMSAERRAKIDRVRMEQDKKLSLAAGILLDRGLREYDLPGLYSASEKQQGRSDPPQTGPGLRNEKAGSDLRGKAVCIKEDMYGKPYLPDFPGLHFNLSHSHEMAMAVFADTEVGCDIELQKKPNEKLAERFFCPEENAWMKAARTETEREERFYRLWTLKESFIKATGQGLRLPLDSFCFRIEETCVPQSEMRGKTRRGNIPAVELRHRNSSAEVAQSFDQAEYMFEEYRVGRDGEYCAAVCLRHQCL
ncbi:MAG: 4'-phosphopantetheinyl transferase superfamily protein [Clostridiales bacterium]|nr:4'-phosphopantetheinyl transferase superfamily protein [Clostridiales bacterium]